jgi:cation/acetate symporter
VMTIWVLAKFDFNLSHLLGAAADKSGKGAKFLAPGGNYGKTNLLSKLDLISLGLALVLGTAGLPHILIRFYTVPDARTARRSVNWAIGLIGAFYLMTLALGFGAAALVGSAAISKQNAAGNAAIIAAVAFATILAVVAGLTLASSSSFAHDIYANVIKRGQASERDEVRVARVAAVLIGAVSIVLSIFARGQNVAFLVALAFAIAASANLPTLLFSLFWRRFNTRGAVWGIYAGLITSIGLVLLSPICWGGKSTTTPAGNATALFSKTIEAPFPLQNPGIISIPVGFLFAYLGTITAKEVASATKYAELEVRSLTGTGAH